MTFCLLMTLCMLEVAVYFLVCLVGQVSHDSLQILNLTSISHMSFKVLS